MHNCLSFEDAAAADTAGSTLVRKRRLLEDDELSKGGHARRAHSVLRLGDR